MATNPISMFPPAQAVQGVSLEPEFLIRESGGVAYAAPGSFLAWLHRAQPGQVCIYARTHLLAKREPIGATVRLIAEAKQVEIWQGRPIALLPWQYFARRTAKPLNVDLGGRHFKALRVPRQG
jgi:hypothetical protein